MTRKPCTHCQRLWHARSLVTVGTAALCPICYKQRRWVRVWPCKDCTPETGRTLICHDWCPRYAAHYKLFRAHKPSVGDRLADSVNADGQIKSMRRRGAQPLQR